MKFYKVVIFLSISLLRDYSRETDRLSATAACDFNPLQISRDKICCQIELFTYIKPLTNEAYRAKVIFSII
jgi:hypothetical protein